MEPTSFYVVGGEYFDTTFKAVVPGTAESYGPFPTYQEARATWFANTCKKVDNCHHRLKVVKI